MEDVITGIVQQVYSHGWEECIDVEIIGGDGGGGNGGNGGWTPPGGGGGGNGNGGGWNPPSCNEGISRGLRIECSPGWQPVLPGTFDFSNSGPSIDLQKYFNCFDQISDNGATYSVKLCADLPVNDNPNVLTSGFSFTPGHAFLTVSKSNGSQSITQSFGFYPVNGALSIFDYPVASKIVNDGNHEYNASISMSISQLDFSAIKNSAINYANNMQYDLDDFNCTDYALNIFNFIRSSSNQIVVPDWVVTGYLSGISPPISVNFGTTPNGLYKKLKEIKDANGPDAANIQIGTYNGPTSYGPCN